MPFPCAGATGTGIFFIKDHFPSAHRQASYGTRISGQDWLVATFHDKFVVEERYMEPGARKALYVGRGAGLVGGAVFFVTLTGVLQRWIRPR